MGTEIADSVFAPFGQGVQGMLSATCSHVLHGVDGFCKTSSVLSLVRLVASRVAGICCPETYAGLLGYCMRDIMQTVEDVSAVVENFCALAESAWGGDRDRGWGAGLS